MKTFKKFLHEKKNERRRQKENLKRPYFNALQTFNTLIDEIDSFDKAIHKRLIKIEENLQLFTLLKARPPPTTFWKITIPPALKHTEKNN